MSKSFKIGGVSKSAGGVYKVRFATDMTRVKILAKTDADIQLVELPEAMDKPALVTYLKTTDLYANPTYKEAIDRADEKYNTVATVKVKAPAKTKPSMAKLKARAEAVGTDSEAAAPYTIIGMLGGMMMSIAPTAVIRVRRFMLNEPCKPLKEA